MLSQCLGLETSRAHDHLWSAAPSDPVHPAALTPSPFEALISDPEDSDVPQPYCLQPLGGGSILLGHLLHGDVAPSSSPK